MSKIPFLKPNVVDIDKYKHYVDRIDRSHYYSNFGPLNTLFEQKVLEGYFDNHGAVTTVNNATTGLMLAISALKRSKGRYALMPSFTFSATALAAVWCGLEPYFIDVTEEEWCMDEKLLHDAINELGDDLAIVIPYDTFGKGMNLSFYEKLSNNGIPVVIDAAASFGTNVDSVQFGKGFSGAVVFSFHATKAFGVGEGGLIYSEDKDLISKIRQSSNFGFSQERETFIQGLNGKMSEFTAAIALATLESFDLKIKHLQNLYDLYSDLFKKTRLIDDGWKLQKTSSTTPHQFLPVKCPKDTQNTEILGQLLSSDIEARTYFDPACHEQELFKKYPSTSLEVTNSLSTSILSLPLWVGLTETQVSKIIGVLKNVR
ncbi:aminotransferase class I/II-fold pyridoxal phosphate-dependent enzyme [Alkalihalobacillus sp. AL-G]|uniref:aminotransferase class I/II-fold pyridoxal phosphate-dependent enzyme n=1 Tax=Alkalihalobacillus sp. AL-G TaxID=2926399 RepID=UPI00272C0E0F|nr:aminotransferase class I/II-fold pyridoxal phosphate-dependent enzyme [Alkalihalobacillus sp. AL-G]WLD93015.1 aminotransferase class I/II-fold pyridoxal phosphate-dependent enzyme [Alkalihalobacillus sp. AL-G]